MNSAVASYRKRLKHCLSCGSKEKRSFLAQFDEMLLPILEENRAPGTQELTIALGTPEQLAQGMMSEISTETLIKWKKHKKFWMILNTAVLVLAFLILLHFVAIKPIELTIQDTITIIN